MEWNVYRHDSNWNKIVKWNIFDHGMFREDMRILLQNNLIKDDFSKRLETTVSYYFWSKTEYEIILKPWVGKDIEVKIDIYNQLKMNWDKFVDYCRNFKEERNG